MHSRIDNTVKCLIVPFVSAGSSTFVRCAILMMNRFGVITHYFEPAAFRRTFRTKRADNHVPALPQLQDHLRRRKPIAPLHMDKQIGSVRIGSQH
jgi:hypothetical protein